MEPHAHTSSLSATAVAILLLAGGLLTASSGIAGNSRTAPAKGKKWLLRQAATPVF
ncbi:hypothetical protein [Hymenobacter psychrotolerans]|uniref:Uncharacterized protein n=1 Tax=Hymenobacter psychrotolerans DSM 18569 TaxID=1121959 RepID=A0A1M6X7V8_9BACT|nr:hypothetical protein [Hymenobacter psychrotolerans]SHL02077.1 hypothetical protein SAMN02746009_01964 [Hymenobacter psychrotolerans DSM 18569]